MSLTFADVRYVQVYRDMRARCWVAHVTGERSRDAATWPLPLTLECVASDAVSKARRIFANALDVRAID